MIIFGSTLSPFVRKTAAFLREKGLEFDLQPTGIPNPSPERCASVLGGGETGVGDSGGFVGSQGQDSGEYLQQDGNPETGFAEQGRGASNQSDVERETTRSQNDDSDIEGSSGNS